MPPPRLVATPFANQSGFRSVNPLIRKLSLVVDVTPDDEDAIRELYQVTRDAPADRDIIRDGDRPDYVTMILEGWACRYKVMRDGSRQITAFMLPGDLCDTQVMLLQEMDHGISALTAAKVAYLSRAQLTKLTSDRPHIGRGLRWTSLVNEAILRAWVVNNGRRPALQRVAHLVCELRARAAQIGLADADEFSMPITQTEIADALGLTGVHVNRVLSKLASLDLMTMHRGWVVITNVTALEHLASFDPVYLHLDRVRGSFGD